MPKSHRILSQYVIREFLRIFSLSLTSLILICILVIFFEKLSLFIRHDANPLVMLEFLLYKIPEAAFQWTLPYAVLMATVLTLGIFSSHSEITAMKASGISLYRITFPLLLFAFLASLCSFMGNEYLVPYANQRTQYLLDVEVRKEEPSSFFKNFKIWYHGDRQIFNIQLLDPQERSLKGVTLYQFDDQFRCIQRIDAKEAKWINGTWRFYGGAVRDFNENGSIRTVPFQEMELPLKETWESFQKVKRDADQLSYSDLATYVEKIRSAGYDSIRYEVSLQAKLSYPFLSFVMVLIGIPFALKTSRSGGIALNIGISVLIAFAYGVTFYVSLSFGKSGLLSPLFAAWTPTLLFSLAGAFTLMSVRQ